MHLVRNNQLGAGVKSLCPVPVVAGQDQGLFFGLAGCNDLPRPKNGNPVHAAILFRPRTMRGRLVFRRTK